MTTPCICSADDPDSACAAIRKSRVTDTLTDESHFAVRLRACTHCGQIYLSLFFESIDWSGGDDSQAWVYIPIAADEADHLRSLWRDVTEQDLLELNLTRRYLVDDFPSGSQRTRAWKTGPVPLFPHD